MEATPYKPEGIDAIVMGFTFEEFRALDDNQVEEVKQGLRASFENDELWEKDFSRMLAVYDFRRFKNWRRHGVPDRGISDEELDEYFTSSVEIKLANDPTFGLIPEDYKTFTPDQRHVIVMLFTYFDSSKCPYEYLGLDRYSLHSTLGYTDEQVGWLVEQNILEQTKGSSLIFSGRYYDHYIRSSYEQYSTEQPSESE